MTIIRKGPDKWLSDSKQLDEKRTDHPAREFGHEPIVKGTFDPLSAKESDEEVIAKLAAYLSTKPPGSYKTSEFRGRTVKVEVIALDKQGDSVLKWTIREKGKVLNTGVLP